MPKKKIVASTAEQQVLKISTVEAGIAHDVDIRTSRSLLYWIGNFLYLATKRFFDILFGIIGCTVIIPVAGVIKVAYLINGDYAPLFFTQKRIGKNGKEFNLYKFRTMIPDADRELKEYFKKNPSAAREYKKNKKLKNDPRITPIGKHLRNSSIDEIPQFLNILIGSMSLVGNRPYMLCEKSEISNEQFDVLVSTKPGITGLWQVSGRSNIDFKKRVCMEVEYSERANLFLDCKIFLKTFKSVITKDGAN